MGAVYDEHMRHEFVDLDLEATMATLVAEPHTYFACRPLVIPGHPVRPDPTERSIAREGIDSARYARSSTEVRRRRDGEEVTRNGSRSPTSTGGRSRTRP